MDSIPLTESKKFYSIFKGRNDRVTLYNANTCKMISIEIKRGEFEITDRIKSHLGGNSRMAIHNHLADNTCTWANVIFNESTRTPTAKDSLRFIKELSKLGLTFVQREKTKIKGENYACWLFFETPISARKVRWFLNLVLKRLNITEAEILPAEDMLTSGSYGSFAWLPYFGGTDKWIESNGDTRVDLGAKMGYTIFIDEEGVPLKNPLANIRKYSEDDFDNAIMLLVDFLPDEEVEGGTKIMDAHFKKLFSKSVAFKEIEEEIKEKKSLKDEAIDLLANICRSFDRGDYFHKLMSRLDSYNHDLFEKKLNSAPATSPFPTYTQLEAIGYGKKETNKFPSRPPYIDRYGKIEEDKNKPQDQWRELSPVTWVFQGIKERLSEEADAETAIIDIEIVDQEEFLTAYEKSLTADRNRLIEKRKICSGLDSGFSSLNQHLNGFKEDTLTIISGATGSGKTALASQILENAIAIDKASGCYITYGESQALLTAKMLSRTTGIDYRKIFRGALTEDEFSRVKMIMKKYKEELGKRLWIIEGNDGMNISKVKAIIDALPIKILCIDNLQNIPFASKVQTNNIDTRFEHLARQLKTLARYKKIAVIATYTTRDAEYNTPELINREFDLLADCDAWLHLEEKGDSGQGVKEYALMIKKNKQGEKNVAIKMGMQHAFQKFI